jgi:hypothetical protein
LKKYCFCDWKTSLFKASKQWQSSQFFCEKIGVLIKNQGYFSSFEVAVCDWKMGLTQLILSGCRTKQKRKASPRWSLNFYFLTFFSQALLGSKVRK